MILAIADAARAGAVRGDLTALGAPGYTELPVIEGSGRTGVHAGDRVHPGSLVAFLTVVEDASAHPMFDGLMKRRDGAGDAVTKFFLLPVERQG
jgi:hypothetical protein